MYRRDGLSPSITIAMGSSNHAGADGFGIRITNSQIIFVNTGSDVSVQVTTTQALGVNIWTEIYFSLNLIKVKFWNNGSSEPIGYSHEFNYNYTHSGDRLSIYFNGGGSNGSSSTFILDSFELKKAK